MKELKNKEIIVGLAALIFLCILALILIVRREFPKNEEKSEMITVQELEIDEVQSESVASNTPAEASVTLNVQKDNIAIKEEEAPIEVEQGEVIASKKVGETTSFHSEPEYKEYTGEEMWQLEEILYYWKDYKLEAVEDLIRLPRVRTITNELSGTNYFFYCGDKDSKGNPSGYGLAVYADNTYYCGEWKSGKRSGKGMWWKIFPDKPGTVNGVPGVIEHSYNGIWANDYPNGEGQEHYGYDYSMVNGEYVITNVIGSFKDGYYDKELYIMTEQGEDSYIDWEAEADRGVFKHCSGIPDKLGKYQVWERLSKVNDDNEDYRWMFDNENKGFGIYSLKMKD